MPTTVNGIGTHYYGKRNRSARTADCPFCHRVVSLLSYDTTLWFVVVFIPVIPLRRKRIIDQCPSCTRHYAANAAAYEQAKQLQISESLERFRNNPGPAEAVLVHAQLLAFREFDQAARLRSGVLPQFPDDVSLRVQLAQQLRGLSAETEAAQLFEEALALDGEHPEARAGVALTRIYETKLDDAHRLLDFLEEPGAAQHYSLHPIDVLAHAEQRAGRHEDALRLAVVLLRELPKLGDQYSFRAFVRKSEKALGRTESFLPRKPFSLIGLFRAKGSPYAPWQRGLAIAGTGFVLLATGLAVNNEYIRRHRTVYVVNACGGAAQVQVDDQPPVSVSDLGRLSVGEGPHTIKVTGPVDEKHQVNLQSGYFERWFRKPAWIVNPGGEAVLEEFTHVYSQSRRPGSYRLIVGELFYIRSDCDYFFEKAPASMEVSQTSKEVTKIELNWLQGRDIDAFHQIVGDNHDLAMTFAERRLRRNPGQSELLQAYLSRAQDEDRPRMKQLLSAGLDSRPVNVSWHRAYQSLGEREVPESELITRYDRYLTAEPANAALLYLRGRLEPDSNKAEPYFRRAIGADTRLAWPWLALAARAAAQAQWDECLAAARQAKELRFEDADQYVHLSRLAKGQAEALVGEYRSRLSAPTPVPLFHLVDALVAAGKTAEIDGAVSAFVEQLPVEVRSQASPFLKAHALYQAGKMKECAAICAQNPLFQRAPLHAQALLAMGNSKAAASDSALAKVWDDPWHALELGVALGLDGQANDASTWRAKAIEKLAAREPAWKRASKLLGSGSPPSIDDLTRLYLTSAEKCLLLVALAQRFPEKQAAYRALATRLNVERMPPYQLVRRALDHPVVSKP